MNVSGKHSKMTQTLLFGFLASTASLALADAQPYKKVAGVSGKLSAEGSDTLNNLMANWSSAFKELYPSVEVQVEGKGSSTAPPALTEGKAQLGPMSRKMKTEEISKFEAAKGYKPTEIAVAVDSLAVYVHKDNPIKELSLQQLDAIFSKTRKGGAAKDIKTWGDLGLKGEWEKMPISLYGRNSASGTNGFFKDEALFKGDFKDTVKEQPGSAAVVTGVSSDRFGIGYSGVGSKTSSVKAVPISVGADKAVEPTFENTIKGEYPLGRFLYVYIAKEPNKPLATLTAEFMKLVLSKEGQALIAKDHYGKLPPDMLEKELAKLHDNKKS